MECEKNLKIFSSLKMESSGATVNPPRDLKARKKQLCAELNIDEKYISHIQIRKDQFAIVFSSASELREILGM